MTATRASIRSALWTALSGLLPGTPTTGVDGCLYTTDDTTSTRPLRSLHRYAGEVSRFAESGREKGVAHTIAGQFPAAFLAFESSMPTGSDGAYVETLAGDIEVTRRIVWSIFVAVNDSTGDGAAESIADDVCERIEGALAGLSIEGLAHGRVVRWLGTVPWVIARRASYVYRLRFSTDADLPETTESLPGDAMSRLDATVQHQSADVDDRAINLSFSRTTT